MNEPWETKQVFVGAWATTDYNVGGLGWYLDDGWEPFAVTRSESTYFIYHLRKRKKVEDTYPEDEDPFVQKLMELTEIAIKNRDSTGSSVPIKERRIKEITCSCGDYAGKSGCCGPNGCLNVAG